MLCLVLGSKLDINKENEQNTAERANHGVIAMNVLIVVVNVMISVFEMKESNLPSETSKVKLLE